MGYPLFVVGGFVRDLLLGEPNLDMDLVVEGNAIRLARRLAQKIGARSRSHRRFGTAKVILEGREAEFGIPSLDFAAARLEFYAHSAALPEVESSNIKADLHRRDFTINTLAIRLDSDHYGRLLDFYGGEQDLHDGLIRVLHSLSFIEDPTRIMRAARFEQRLGFEIEPRTAELIGNALPMLGRVSAERIRHELYLILREPEPERVLGRLDELSVLSQIHPKLSCTEETCQRFARLRQMAEAAAWDVAVTESGQPPPGLYLAVWTCDLSRREVEGLVSLVKPFRQDVELLREVMQLQSRSEALAQPDLANHEVYELLRHSTSGSRLAYWLCNGDRRVQRRLWRYESELRHVEPVVDGTYLKGLGLEPSPLFGQVLGAVRDARLDGEIETEQEEKALIAQLLAGQGA
jgi:tRNA nucleotidyltransferase (CCA-adding enzyme)